MTALSTMEDPVLDLAFRFGRSRWFGRELGFVALAAAAHLGLAFGYHPPHRTFTPAPRVTEVELARSLPAPAPPTPAPLDDPVGTPQPKIRPAPAAARAGALVTAKASAPAAANNEPVDFVTDPNGTSYGSGVVAHGGTADHGVAGATYASKGAPVGGPPSTGPSLTSASNLSRRASLGEPNACAGFYPGEAREDAGSATVTVVVRADGSVVSTSIVSESPAGQGFGKAARACLLGKRFEPALDRAGSAVDAATTIRLRFVR